MSRVDEEMAIGGDIVAPDLNNSKQQQPVEKISRVRTSGADSETVHIGDTVVNKHELVEAFKGMIKPESMNINNLPKREFGNPAPLGLCGFALTTFVLSLVNMHARHVTIPNVVMGLAFFYGGAAQLLAGMWEIACGNTFGATAFASYGAFWLSFAAINTESFGIAAAYEGEEEMMANGVGFFLFGWFIFTSCMALCAVRTTVCNFALFFFLSITFLLLACGELTAKVGVSKAGGWFGLITSFIAWYNAFKAIANKENSFLELKDRRMPGNKKYD